MEDETYRVEVKYTVRRVVYVEAETKAQAKQRAKSTAEWVEEFDPEMDYDSIVALRATQT